MFNTSKEEIKELLVSLGHLTIYEDFLEIKNYPFEPSIAFSKVTFRPDEIDEIDIESHPPTIRIKDELIFLTAEKLSDLERFSTKNSIKTIHRPNIWSWVLEPFLDTEYTSETDQRIFKLLNNYGLTAESVKSLRNEVEVQMLKYNFDTLLWEWCILGALDVLRAMRTRYKKEQFKEFYERVMKIALLTTKN